MTDNSAKSQKNDLDFKRSWLSSIALKIILISVLAVSSFIVYIAIIYFHTELQASSLAEIRDKRYPVQAKTQSALFNLKMIQVQMENTVLTGEVDSLNEANRLKKRFEKDLQDIVILDSAYDKKISQIVTIFKHYFSSSDDLVVQMLDVGSIPDAENGKIVYSLYLQLIELLEAFEIQETNTFNSEINKLATEANTIVEIGLPLTLLIIVLIFFLSFTTARFIIQRVNNIIHVSRKVASEDSDMSVRIEIDGNDEMTELAYWFNRFIDKIERLSVSSTIEIKRLAYTDALSGLPNRRLSNKHLEAEIENSKKNQSKLALIFLDLDNFKYVNDNLGHDAGDMVVCEVAKRLKGSLRKSDIVIVQMEEADKQLGKSMVARIGGDEFMIILPNIADQKQVSTIAQRIKSSVLEPMKILDVNIEVGVSMGIALYPMNGKSAKDLTINADIAMYDAKSAGKNTFRFFTKKLSEELTVNTIIENFFKKIFKEKSADSIYFYYQPQFNLKTKKVEGAEALIRVNHPKLGDISPGQFIPFLENSDLILELDKAVIDKVCYQIRTWIDAEVNLVPIAINISAKQACRDDLIDLISQNIDKYNLPLGSIRIEITETSALRDIETLTKNITKLEAISVKVALDDFGAGHASLSAFAHCQIDTLKIDRQFIDDFNINKQKLLIVEGIIKLAKSLNITTVAEGIETERQFDTLVSLGCDLGQGYYLSKPVTDESFVKLLENM